MQCYESEKLAEHAVDSDFDHTSLVVPALYLEFTKLFFNFFTLFHQLFAKDCLYKI